jgi:hypothetical protein
MYDIPSGRVQCLGLCVLPLLPMATENVLACDHELRKPSQANSDREKLANFGRHDTLALTASRFLRYPRPLLGKMNRVQRHHNTPIR